MNLFIEKSFDYNLIQELEKLKNGLITKCTTSNTPEITDDDYKRIRKIICNNPSFRDKLPEFILNNRSLNEFDNNIKNKISTYKDRRDIINSSVNLLIDELENGVEKFQNDFIYLNEIRKIGEGGFGEVFLFNHKLLNMEFAIKKFSPHPFQGSNTESHLARFFQEAKILFKLNHKNIISIYDVNMFNNIPFFKMEYFESVNLDKFTEENGLIDPEISITIILKLCDALNYAYKTCKVVHRDLKPSNILINREKEVKVIDFGLGILVEQSLENSRITVTGESIASGFYSAPELFDNPKLVDLRSDIYSLGVIWCKIISGHKPGVGIEKILSEKNVKFAEIILKCVNTSINDRFLNWDELISAINDYKGTHSENKVSLIDANLSKDLNIYVEQIFDPYFVTSNEYANALINEFPKEILCDISIEILKNRKKGDLRNLELCFKEIFNNLEDSDKNKLTNVFSEEFNVITLDNEIFDLLRLFNSSCWEKLKDRTKIRIENLIIKSVNSGRYRTFKNQLESGKLGIFACVYGKYFKLKPQLVDTLIEMLKRDYYSQDYVSNYFLLNLPEIISPDKVKETCKNISYALFLNPSNLIRSNMLNKGKNLPLNWKKEIIKAAEQDKTKDLEYFKDLKIALK